MTKIESIEFCNYRQYKDIKISFPSNGENEIHILRAKNGTGKTTFLKGILWCLYGKENQNDVKHKSLKVINENLVQQLKENEVAEATVKMIVSDDEYFTEFERKQKFTITKDPFSDVQKNIAKELGPSELIIKRTSKNDNSNTQIIEDRESSEMIVKQCFDETIHEYYFFDGENLKNYFNATNSSNIKTSIFNLSQVTLLENAIKHTTAISTEKARKSSSIGVIDPKLYEEIDTLQQEINAKKEENNRIDIELPKIENQKNKYAEMLKGYEPVKAQQEARERFSLEHQRLTLEYENVIKGKEDFLRKYYMLLKFYPVMKKTLNIIDAKDKAGLLPPSVDKYQLQKIINNHIMNCPVCDNHISEASLDHIRDLLRQLEVSAKTSNYLMSVRGGLQVYVEEAEKYEIRKNEIIKKEKYYNEELNRISDNLKEISSFLANYSGNEAVDVRKIEEELRRLSQKGEELKVNRKLNDSILIHREDELKNRQIEIEKLEAKAKDKNGLLEQVKVLRYVTSYFEKIKNEIMGEIKDEIQNKTWEYFDNMIWKKNTFKRININDDYQMTVYNINDNEMTGSLSATEYMALAYSFTFAIHEASGKNCPLVVDSPLGRVSDENRVNMAKELLKISKEKQIIMLFTPDEYSAEVAEVYDNNSSTNRIITLSSDEKEIEKVGDQ